MTPSAGFSVDIATWMLEHLIPRPYSEVLAGDLLEEFHTGRSALWYWRQAVTAIALCAASRCGSYAIPMAFSAAWSLLYPTWQTGLWNSRLARSFFSRGASLDWPLSGIADLSRGVLPVITFICFGLFFYLLLRTHTLRQPSILRLTGSLSLGLNVFLVTLIVLHRWAGSLGDRFQVTVYQAPLHHAINIPLTLSLLSAILTALPPSRQRQRLAHS